LNYFHSYTQSSLYLSCSTSAMVKSRTLHSAFLSFEKLLVLVVLGVKEFPPRNECGASLAIDAHAQNNTVEILTPSFQGINQQARGLFQDATF
jgi:hypothetical protein